jgi:hypothetical protein
MNTVRAEVFSGRCVSKSYRSARPAAIITAYEGVPGIIGGVPMIGGVPVIGGVLLIGGVPVIVGVAVGVAVTVAVAVFVQVLVGFGVDVGHFLGRLLLGTHPAVGGGVKRGFPIMGSCC